MPGGGPFAKRGANLRKISLDGSRWAAGQKLYLRTKNSELRLAGLIFLMIVASSCFDEGDCLVTNSNLIRVSLLNFSDKKPAKILFTSVSIQGETLLYPPNTELTTLVLPVDPGRTEMEYVLEYQGKSDTIRFSYDNFSFVLSPTCGAFPYQQNLVVAETTFGEDKVVITDKSLLRNVAENVRLYF
jgi:hypothetical protein